MVPPPDNEGQRTRYCRCVCCAVRVRVRDRSRRLVTCAGNTKMITSFVTELGEGLARVRPGQRGDPAPASTEGKDQRRPAKKLLNRERRRLVRIPDPRADSAGQGQAQVQVHERARWWWWCGVVSNVLVWCPPARQPQPSPAGGGHPHLTRRSDCLAAAALVVDRARRSSVTPPPPTPSGDGGGMIVSY